jgi:LysR family transcriptional regulator, hydrogen peroxide-inducible genes activator
MMSTRLGTTIFERIKLAAPAPGRRIGLAWRRGFTRPQVIEVIREAVRALKVPV